MTRVWASAFLALLLANNTCSPIWLDERGERVNEYIVDDSWWFAINEFCTRSHVVGAINLLIFIIQPLVVLYYIIPFHIIVTHPA